MIFIGKCPYRISLLGGGSDLDWFVSEEGYGNSIGFSLDKYSYTIIDQTNENKITLSKLKPDEIKRLKEILNIN